MKRRRQEEEDRKKERKKSDRWNFFFSLSLSRFFKGDE